MHTNKQLEVFPSSLVNGIVVLDARHEAWRKRCLEIGRSHSESLFYFVPQEKRLTRRSPWEWKNMRDYFFFILKTWISGPKLAKSMMAHAEVELGRNRSRICACENKPHGHLYNRNPRTENEPGRESSWGKCHPALCLSHLPSPFLPSPLKAVIFSKHLVILLNLLHLPLPPKLNFLHDTSFKTSFTEPMGRVKCIADIPIYQTAKV